MGNARETNTQDGWGEPILEDSDTQYKVPRRWLSAALGLLFVVLAVLGYLGFRHHRVRQLSADCRESAAKGDWDGLSEAAAAWRRWEPSKAAPLIYMAEAAVGRKQVEEAATYLDLLPDLDPKTPPALVERSAMLFGPLNRSLEGAAALERALALDPTLDDARQRLIYFYAFTLQRRKMVHHAYEAMRHDTDLPETYVYLMLQDSLSFANAYAENTKWLQAYPDEELFHVARAVYRVAAKSLDEPSTTQRDGPAEDDGTPYHRKIMADYFRRYPGNLELRAYHLELATNQGNVDEAARLLADAPADAEFDNRFWRLRGWLHGSRGEYQQAENCYRRALLLNVYDYRSRHQLAAVVRRARRMDEVRELEELTREGKEVRANLLRLETVTKVPPALLGRMAEYARRCGDYTASTKLKHRVEQFWGKESEPSTPKGKDSESLAPKGTHAAEKPTP